MAREVEDPFDALHCVEARLHEEGFEEGALRGGLLGFAEGREAGVESGVEVGSEVGAMAGEALGWLVVLARYRVHDCTQREPRRGAASDEYVQKCMCQCERLLVLIQSFSRADQEERFAESMAVIRALYQRVRSRMVRLGASRPVQPPANTLEY